MVKPYKNYLKKYLFNSIMPVSYRDFFQLKDNYTIEELKQARNNKINTLAKLDISEQDKKAYAEHIINLYNEAKFDLAHLHSLSPFRPWSFNLFNDNFFNEIEKSFQFNKDNIDQYNSYSSASSYQSITNSDGTKTVIEKNKTSKNGKLDEKINTYQVDKSGTKQPITLDEALCTFNKNTQSKPIYKKIDYNI